MAGVMAVPAGFRFHPTDEELVAYYLKRKVAGSTIECDIIPEIDLCKHEPWDLEEKCSLVSGSGLWYFFCPRDKKYLNDLRINRATEAGYWKAIGKDREVVKAGRLVGMKKTLVFYRGRAPRGEKTYWAMHEYRMDEEESEKVNASQELVLCRVFRKRSWEDRGPQTYVDDDIDKKPSGSFVEAVKKALEPESAPALPVPEAAPIESPQRLRDQIIEMLKALHELIPKTNQADTVSMLDEVAEYLQHLKMHQNLPEVGIVSYPGMGMSDPIWTHRDVMAPGRTSHLIAHMSHGGMSFSGSPTIPHPSHIEGSCDVFETVDKLEKEQCLNGIGTANRNIAETPHSHQICGKRSELMDNFLVEVNDVGESGYFVSKIWLFNLQEHEREEVMTVLQRTGYLEIYETCTTMFYERMEDAVQLPTTTCTPDNNDVCVGAMEQGIASNDTGEFGKIEETSFNAENHDDIFHLTRKTEAGPKTHVKCLCRSQLLAVSFTSTSSSQERPSTSFFQGAQHVSKRSTRQRGSDCYVTMPKLRQGRIVSTSVDKDISMTTINFTETGGYQEVPVTLKVSAETSLSCCVRSDHGDKQVLVELLQIRGAVTMDESIDKKTNALVLKSVRTNLDASLNDSEEISLQGDEDYNFPPRRRVLEASRPCGDTGQSKCPEDLIWLELSGIHPRHSEPGSKTLELQCHVLNRLKRDREECSHAALVLHFEGSPPMKFKGEILADLDPNSFLELNLRYQAEISYSEPCTPLPSADTPCLRGRRVSKVVDFDCLLEFRTQNLYNDWSVG